MKNLFLILVMLTTINARAQWVTNYTDTSIYFMDIQFSSSNTGWVAGLKYNTNGTTEGRLLKTTNAGGNWVLQNVGTIAGLWGVYFINDNTGWIVGDKGTVRKTTNSGLNWIQQITDSTDYLNQAYIINSNTGWITGNNLYKTSNSGNNWNKINGIPGGSFAIYFLNDNTGFLTLYYSRILKTTNGGLNWDLVYSGSFHTFVFDITFCTNDVGFAAGDGSAEGVLKTTNGGNNWSSVYHSDLKTIYFKNSNTGWAGGYSTILKTTNSGQNWVTQNLPISFPDYVWKIRNSNDSTLWAVGGKGYIFKTSNGGVGINQISTEIPSKYSLGQNYPNPFNPSTVVRYQLSVVGNVSLKVYDVQGREVQTLVNERLQPGTYEVTFDGSKLNSGVYFYQLLKGDFKETKKMLLLK